MKKEEENAVKDYFLNITNHHTKVMGDGEIMSKMAPVMNDDHSALIQKLIFQK